MFILISNGHFCIITIYFFKLESEGMYGDKTEKVGSIKEKRKRSFCVDAVETTSVGSHAYAVGVGASNFQLFIKFLFLTSFSNFSN